MNGHDLTIQAPMSASISFAVSNPQRRKAIVDANKDLLKTLDAHWRVLRQRMQDRVILTRERQ